MGPISINPPPKKSTCLCCGKKERLRKTYRQTDPLGGVSASWECKNCINLDYKGYLKIKNRKGDLNVCES